jgi:Protein of unknown function (DUF3617)
MSSVIAALRLVPRIKGHQIFGRCVLVLAASLSLLACNKTADRVGDGEVSRDERAGRIPADISLPLKAGMWQSTVTFTQIEVPGLNQKKKQDIMTRMSKAASKKACLTTQQAPRPPADFFGGGMKDACKYRNFSVQKSQVKMALSCEMDGMAIADMDMRGNMIADQFGLDVSTDLRLPMVGKVKLTGRSEGRFLGTCG